MPPKVEKQGFPRDSLPWGPRKPCPEPAVVTAARSSPRAPTSLARRLDSSQTGPVDEWAPRPL